jgi:hypothetical protein
MAVVDIRVEVRQDADGRWNWQVRTADDKYIASCLDDMRSFRRKGAVKNAQEAAATYRHYEAAKWEEVGESNELSKTNNPNIGETRE